MSHRGLTGYATLTGPLGAIRESSTFTCAHCNSVRHVQARQSPESIGGLCYVCNELICEQCVGKGCDPLEEKLKRIEARYHALRSYQG